MFTKCENKTKNLCDTHFSQNPPQMTKMGVMVIFAQYFSFLAIIVVKLVVDQNFRKTLIYYNCFTPNDSSIK